MTLSNCTPSALNFAKCEIVQQIERSQGLVIARLIFRMKTDVYIIEKNSQELLTAIKADIEKAFDFREDIFSNMKEIMRLMHNALAASESCLQHIKTTNEKHKKENKNKICLDILDSLKQFRHNNVAKLVLCLRNIIQHVDFTDIIWSIQSTEQEPKCSYYLNRKAILNHPIINQKDKRTIEEYQGSLDIYNLFSDYKVLLLDFVHQCIVQVESAYKDDLDQLKKLKEKLQNTSYNE